MNQHLRLLSKRKLIIALSVLLWLVLFFSGLSHFAGSKFIYTAFSFVSLLMLLSGIYQRVSYSYLFLVIFLWLGFWFKLTASFLLSGYFSVEEPIGNFNDSADAWNQVLWIAMAGSIGITLSFFIYSLFFPTTTYSAGRAKVPEWYRAVRIWLWACVLIITISVAALNIFQGIHQVGLTPRTILPWPLNALVAWTLNMGSALAVAVLLWWDMVAEENTTPALYAMLIEAFISAVSVISRSAFLFHAIPQMLALSREKKISQIYTRKEVLLFTSIFTALFLISIASVSFLRDHQYAASKSVRMPMPQLVTNSGGNSIKSAAPDQMESVEKIPSFRIQLVRQLVINRWIGIEGVMAISSYPEKSYALLWEMMTEKRESGKVNAYQKISNSGYQNSDYLYQFSSLPGAIAFLLYSGSITVVVLGMTLLGLLALTGERVVFLLTKNPLMCSLFGMAAANTVAQFGVAPRQDVPYFLMIFSLAIIVWILQSAKFASMLNHLHVTSNSVP